jgi:hypothetical protein
MGKQSSRVPVRPSLEPLEDRTVPSALTDSFFTVPPLQNHLPRTGGVAVQTGSVLAISLASQHGLNQLQITDDGKGDVQASWDGGPVHSFTGVNTIELFSKGGGIDDVNFNLTGPLTAPLNLEVGLGARLNLVNLDVDGNAAGANGLTLQVEVRHGAHDIITES